MEEPALVPRRDGRRRDTRERIHDVALGLFVSQGFSATTMQDVADRLELTKAAVYYHHATKADLIRSVVQPAIDAVNEFLSEARSTTPDRREVLEGFFDLNYTYRSEFLALLRDPSALAVADTQGWVPRLAQEFQELLAGPNATDQQRIGAVMAGNGLSRCATVLTEIPYERLRSLSVEAALTLLDLPDLSATGQS